LRRLLGGALLCIRGDVGVAVNGLVMSCSFHRPLPQDVLPIIRRGEFDAKAAMKGKAVDDDLTKENCVRSALCRHSRRRVVIVAVGMSSWKRCKFQT